MPIKSVYEPYTIQATINKQQIEDLVRFLSKPYDLQLDPKTAQGIVNTKPLIITPITSVYNKCLELGLVTNTHAFVQANANLPTFPEIITYTHVLYDMYQLQFDYPTLYQVMKNHPQYKDKIIFNVTPLVKSNGTLTDTLTFQATIVRDLLSRSYAVRGARNGVLWTSVPLLLQMCKVYSMTFSGALGNAFDLDVFTRKSLGTVFSFYFLSQTSNAASAREIMLGNYKKLGLGEPVDITSVLDQVESVIKDRYRDMSFDDALEAVNGLGISRVTNVDRRLIFEKLKSLGPDSLTSITALQYPPYWCYMLLLAGSGGNRCRYLLSILKNTNMVKEINSFAEELSRNTNFLSTITP